MNAALPVFTETDLARWIDARSLARGRAYFQSGAIEQPTHSAAADTHSLAALCHGSRASHLRRTRPSQHQALGHFAAARVGRNQNRAPLIHIQQAAFNYWSITDPIDLTAIASNITHVADLSTP